MVDAALKKHPGKKHPGRKPAHLVSSARKPGGRQAVWAAIRRLRDGFTLPALAKGTDIHRDTIRTYLRGLEAAGYIVRDPVEPGRFVLVNDIGVEAPRVTRDGKPVTQGIRRENMWRTMRMMRGDFSWRDLTIAASTEEFPVDEEDAKDYCAALAKAGYLVVTVKGKGGGKSVTPTRWRFNPARFTGPAAPMVQRLQSVFDPNLGKVVWQEDARDE